ncbi:AGE family epimerase/isomerase [Streptomyces sp. NBS 14/10]|uniref:AGE family epimerase/isomerase n=1 Tax=Streptomyces sp. NBS 14/10 TaxID=1945643 RepID=UPI000B7EE1B1|nr:AGE family epimerase/isomerase [Streptomyces sp. NBS 14/10]KAK1184363.1 AGE family epimerase/isomerase [Streptomyces sp. NBS 14/10]
MRDHHPQPGPVHGTAWLATETRRLLDFAAGSVHPGGGFAWLDRRGHPDTDLPIHAWITCRMTHVFALGQFLGHPAPCQELVERGVRALSHQLRDAEHGGWFSAVHNGQPVTTEKSAYTHAFVLLAASSAVAAGAPGADPLLDEALHVWDEYFWDDHNTLAVDTWDQAWTNLDPYRGVNPNMHAVEAMLAVTDVTGDQMWRQRALPIVERVIHGFAREHDWLLPEHFNTAWEPELDYNISNPGDQLRPYGVTVGHLLEWARFCLHLRASLGAAAPAWLLDDAVALFEKAVACGWNADGLPGFVYTIDWNEQPVVTSRLHWVIAEAISAAAALYQATGDVGYKNWYHQFWDHAGSFIDRAHGSWHHELDANLRPADMIWQGKPDVYHAFQATLIPRLPLAPTLATALRNTLLDEVAID